MTNVQWIDESTTFRVGQLVFLGGTTRATIIQLHDDEATVQYDRGRMRQRVKLTDLKTKNCNCGR